MTMDSNVVKFPSNASRRTDFLEQRAAVQDQAPSASYPKRSKRNPLRTHLNMLSIAIVQANKPDHHLDDDALEWIRKGEAAARALTNELARIASRVPPRTMARELDSSKVAAIRQFVRQVLEEEGLK
jgi:hypothetical protein